MVVCHRAGYSSITPQTCIEKHVKNEEACGECRQSRVSLAVIADAADSDPETIIRIARNGDVSKISNPLIRKESLPDTNLVIDDEKGKKNVNTRIIFINGRRIPQGMIFEFKQSGGFADRALFVYLLKSAIESMKTEVKDIAIDEYVNGRLTTRYEWSSSDKKTFGDPVESDVKKNNDTFNVVGFRMNPVSTDNFVRG